MGVSQDTTLIFRITGDPKRTPRPSLHPGTGLFVLLSHPCLPATPCGQSSSPGGQGWGSALRRDQWDNPRMPEGAEICAVCETQTLGVHILQRRFPQQSRDSRTVDIFPSKLKVVFFLSVCLLFFSFFFFLVTVVGFRTANQRGVLIPQTAPRGKHFSSLAKGPIGTSQSLLPPGLHPPLRTHRKKMLLKVCLPLN